MSYKKRVRREEADWPSPEETNRQIARKLFKNKLPFKDWKPSQDVSQAVAIAHDIAWKRGWSFELKWISYCRNVMYDAWEARLTQFIPEAMERGDYKRAIEEYAGKAAEPAMATCRAILNLIDGVESSEYWVCPHPPGQCPADQDDDEEDDEEEDEYEAEI